MKPLRAHNVLHHKAPEPDFRGLKRILLMFIVGAVASLGICPNTIAYEARRGHGQAAQVPCTCIGRCLRRESPMIEKLVDINELSRRLSIPRGSLYNLVYQRRIPFLKIGRSLRFDVDAIEQYLKRHSQDKRREDSHGHR